MYFLEYLLHWSPKKRMLNGLPESVAREVSARYEQSEEKKQFHPREKKMLYFWELSKSGMR